MSLASQILARRMRLPRARTLDVVCQRDLPATMDDGTVLLADRWVAADQHEPQPTVLVRSPYGRRQVVGMLLGRLLAERGLAVVLQSVRGTFGSGGRFSPFDERDDGLATLRWIRDQPWHAGPIGTIGPSYLGFVQWAVAGQPGADLAAMSIHVSASQFYDQTYAGGSLSLETLGSWMVLLAAQESRLAPVAINRALRGLAKLWAELPLGDLDERATGAPVRWFREAFGDIDRKGAYWSARDFSSTVPEVTAPVSFVGGWYDILLPWMLADFEALQASRPRAAAADRTVEPHLAGADRRQRARRDRLAAGSPAGRRSPRARRTGAGDGHRRAHRRRLARAARRGRRPAPGSGGCYLDDGGTLSDQPATTSGADGYRYDPADPTPSLGGPVLLERSAVVDNAPLEARDDVLTYTTAPLAQTVEAIGHVSVELWARASEPYFDLFARVCDVDADGVSRNVSDALTSIAPGRAEQNADGTWRVTCGLWPIGHRFAAGHRIRLQVSSGAHPRYARNPGTGDTAAHASAETMRAVEIEILRSAEHPSALVLPTGA